MDNITEVKKLLQELEFVRVDGLRYTSRNGAESIVKQYEEDDYKLGKKNDMYAFYLPDGQIWIRTSDCSFTTDIFTLMKKVTIIDIVPLSDGEKIIDTDFLNRIADPTWNPKNN